MRRIAAASKNAACECFGSRNRTIELYPCAGNTIVRFAFNNPSINYRSDGNFYAISISALCSVSTTTTAKRSAEASGESSRRADRQQFTITKPAITQANLVLSVHERWMGYCCPYPRE